MVDSYCVWFWNNRVGHLGVTSHHRPLMTVLRVALCEIWKKKSLCSLLHLSTCHMSVLLWRFMTWCFLYCGYNLWSYWLNLNPPWLIKQQPPVLRWETTLQVLTDISLWDWHCDTCLRTFRKIYFVHGNSGPGDLRWQFQIIQCVTPSGERNAQGDWGGICTPRPPAPPPTTHTFRMLCTIAP